MIHRKSLVGCLVTLLSLPSMVMAQSVNVSRSILPDEPYTVIYPEGMVASGGAGQPLTINHTQAPLQCDLSIVPADDAGWTPDGALAGLDKAAIASGWTEQFPGFAISAAGTIGYQSGPALQYEATSTGSPMGMPLTIVHTETVDSGRGYVLDCLFATAQAAQARPLVDFIIANFSTRADADCCVGATPVSPPPAQ